MNLLAFTTTTVTGFIACAEFGSYPFVHPVLRRLPTRERITVERALIRTFGRVMPPGMILCVVLGISSALDDATILTWAAAIALTAAVTTSVIVNVPINLATSRWDPGAPPTDWTHTRTRWERFQGLRSWLLLAGFILTTAAMDRSRSCRHPVVDCR